MKKEMNKNISRVAWIYGAFFGFMPAYIFTLVTVASYEGFRAIYYLRFVLAIIIGALVGGYVTSFAVSLGLQLIKKQSYFINAIVGLILGAICGAIVFVATPLMLLIQSTDVSWALTVIYRSSLLGAIMGAVAGLFFGIGLYKFLRD